MLEWIRRLVAPKHTPEEIAAETAALEDALREWRRPTTLLRPVAGSVDDAPLGSRTGGRPLVRPGEAWPSCAGCGRPFDFLGQFDLRDADSFESRPFDLVHLFFCWHCFPWEDEGPRHGWTFRTWTAADAADLIPLSPPDPGEQTTKPTRLEASPSTILPGWEELYAVAPELAERLDRHPEAPDILEHLEERLGIPTLGDGDATLIGGYPTWIQGEEAPRTDAGKRLDFLLQLDSVPQAGWMWGDGGIFYLFHDPETSTDLRFRLQCY